MGKRYHTWFCHVGLVSYLSRAPPNERIWHKAVFMEGLVAGPKPTCVRHCQKYLRPCRHSPYYRCLRRQAKTQLHVSGVKAWGDSPLRSEEISSAESTPDRAAPTKTLPTDMRLKQLERQTKHGGLAEYLSRAPPNERVWHKAFLRWSGSRAAAHMRPAMPKIPSAFPLLGAPGNKPNAPLGEKA